MTGISVEHRAELRALADKAAPPPWSWTQGMDHRGFIVADWAHEDDEAIAKGYCRGNGEFIAAARSAVPELLDEIDRLEQDAWLVESNVAQVYCDITDGALSKPTYEARVVLAHANDATQKLIDEETAALSARVAELEQQAAAYREDHPESAVLVLRMLQAERRVAELEQQLPPVEVIHHCPLNGSGITSCCGRSPFQLPRTDRITVDPALATCSATNDTDGGNR